MKLSTFLKGMDLPGWAAEAKQMEAEIEQLRAIGKPLAEWLLSSSWDVTTDAQAAAATLAVEWLEENGGSPEQILKMRALIALRGEVRP